MFFKKKEMDKFKKQPVTVEAFRVMEDMFDNPALIPIVFAQYPQKQINIQNKHFIISTLEGNMKANIGDWIIKGVKGEWYPCKHDVFEKTYIKLKKE